MAHLLDLPNEIIAKILSHIDKKSFINLCLSHNKFRELYLIPYYKNIPKNSFHLFVYAVKLVSVGTHPACYECDKDELSDMILKILFPGNPKTFDEISQRQFNVITHFCLHGIKNKTDYERNIESWKNLIPDKIKNECAGMWENGIHADNTFSELEMYCLLGFGFNHIKKEFTDFSDNMQTAKEFLVIAYRTLQEGVREYIEDIKGFIENDTPMIFNIQFWNHRIDIVKQSFY